MNIPQTQNNKTLIWFNADDVCRKVSCQRLVEDEYSIVISNHRSVAFWRSDANNPNSVAYYDDKGTCTDFVADKTYNVITLCQEIKGFGFAEAVNYLGERYCYGCKLDKPFNAPKNTHSAPSIVPAQLPAAAPQMQINIIGDLPSALPMPPQNHYEQLLQDGFKVVKEYSYTNANGELVFSVLRLEKDDKKEFLQRAADGSFFVKDVEKVLYNLPSVIRADKVYICEGEKCADCMIEHGFIATTASAGAGKGRWNSSYSECLRGKDIVILTDGDEKGKGYGLLLANELSRYAKTVKVITPIDEPKKDIVDYFMLGKNSLDDFAKLEESTPIYKTPRFGEVTAEMVEIAKLKNETPFSNYVERKENGKTIFEPIQPLDLLNDFFARFLNFPCLLGKDMLFDHDRDTHEIIELDKPQKLFAWINLKSKKNYLWKSANGFVEKQEFYNMVCQHAHRFELISSTPDFPFNPSTYYTYPTLPPPSPTHEYFNRFCESFTPDGKFGLQLIKAIFLTPMYYKTSATKPSWIIDSRYGKGVGKTTIYDLIAKLYMCAPIQVHRSTFKNSDELDKRLVSNSGRKSKIFAIDNIEGKFSNEILAQYITASTLSGRAPYSAGEDSRPNNLTYIITCNSAEINGDLTSRSYFLYLKRFNNQNTRWKEDREHYIEQYRWHIFADMLDIISNHKIYDCDCFSRHRQFEMDVMQAVCDTEEDYKGMMEEIQASAVVANVDSESCQEIIDIIANELTDLKFNPQTDSVWIPTNVLKKWLNDNGIDKTIANIRQYVIDKHTERLDISIEQFPRTSGKARTRGVMWVGEKATRDMAITLQMIGKKITRGSMELYNRK